MSALQDVGGALTGLLESIDDGKLRQVIRLVERSGQRRTLEPALADLRPRLRRLRPRRPLTPARLLTIPLASALDTGGGRTASFSIARERLAAWQKRIAECADPAVMAQARRLIDGRSADDEAAVLAAGCRLWPEAARVLATGAVPGEPPGIEAERLRAADLLRIADHLVPRLGRLPRNLSLLDAEEEAAIAAVLALADGAPTDRLGTLAALLLRRSSRPSALAHRLIDLAPRAQRGSLRALLQQLLAEHRAGLARQLASLGAAPEPPLDEAIETLARLAAAVIEPNEAGTGKLLDRWTGRHGAATELAALRRTAATIAHERYTATVGRVLAALPPAGAPARAAAVKAREETARRLARLGSVLRRLSPATSLHELTGPTIERLVDLAARRRGRAAMLVSVEDARLIEILAGPELAWRYLRPDGDRQAEHGTADGHFRRRNDGTSTGRGAADRCFAPVRRAGHGPERPPEHTRPPPAGGHVPSSRIGPYGRTGASPSVVDAVAPAIASPGADVSQNDEPRPDRDGCSAL